MTNHRTKPSKEDLISQLSSSGWELKTGIDGAPLTEYTLEQAVRSAHSKHKSGQSYGVIAHLQNAIELDLIQLQLLWEHLGLPL